MNKLLVRLSALAFTFTSASLHGVINITYDFNASVNGATAGEDVIDLTPSIDSTLSAVITASDLGSSIGFATAETGGAVNPTSITNTTNAAGNNPYIHNGSAGGEPRNIDGSFAFNIAGRATRNGTEKFLTFTVDVPENTEVQLFTFSFDVRHSADNGNNSDGANSFRVLVDGVQVGLAQSHDSAAIINLSFDLASVTPLTTDFTVALGMVGGGGTSRSAILDNITLTAVPEPATYALLAGIATLGCVLLRQRRRG